MEDKQNTDRIVDEAVGQTHGNPRPAEGTPPEETIRRNAAAPGPLASMAEKTAASIGERVGDAYSDTGSSRRGIPRQAATCSPHLPQNTANRAAPAGHQMAQGISEAFSDQRLTSLVAAFGMGFIAAVLLQRRR